MFTGLIRHTGEIVRIDKSNDFSIDIKSAELALTSRVGDSISVNGICLTISNISDELLTFDLVGETVNRTTANNWQIGQFVHLEPAMLLSDRLDGHLISGHIDSVVALAAKEQKAQALALSFYLPKDLEGYVIEKGSVTLDGVSLTVAALNTDEAANTVFSVWLIPTTIEKSHLSELRVGDEINLEVDLIGKYVVQNLKRYGQ
jgi:riboflavin synthase